MIPIIGALLGTLAESGLGLLSSAIQAKGKAGRLPNNQRDPKLKYPNTKNWYE